MIGNRNGTQSGHSRGVRETELRMRAYHERLMAESELALTIYREQLAAAKAEYNSNPTH
jgi:hypothetical protein